MDSNPLSDYLLCRLAVERRVRMNRVRSLLLPYAGERVGGVLRLQCRRDGALEAAVGRVRALGEVEDAVVVVAARAAQVKFGVASGGGLVRPLPRTPSGFALTPRPPLPASLGERGSLKLLLILLAEEDAWLYQTPPLPQRSGERGPGGEGEPEALEGPVNPPLLASTPARFPPATAAASAPRSDRRT